MKTVMTVLALALFCVGTAAEERPMTASQTAAERGAMERALMRIDPRLALPVGHPHGYPDADSYAAVWQAHRQAYLRFQAQPCGSLYHPCHDDLSAQDPCADGATLPPEWCQVVARKIEAALQAYDDKRSAADQAKAEKAWREIQARR